MATSRAGGGTDLSELQRQMAQIRHEMHEEVRGAVRGAQSLTDWRRIVANHPWAALGIAAAAGFLVVPSRRARRMDQSLPTTALAQATQSPAPYRGVPSPVAGLGVLRTALGLLTPVIARAAQNYALNQIEHWLAENAFRFKEMAEARAAETVQAPRADQSRVAPTIPFRDRLERP